MTYNILLTGGYGFFGNHFYEMYKNDHDIFRFRKEEYDLQSYDNTLALFAAATHKFKREFSVVNLAGWNGGIQFNKLYPAKIYTDNVTMANNLFRVIAASQKVDKVVSCLASCAFPPRDRELKAFEILLKEPHPSVACHGYAKRHLELLTRFYGQQYGINAVTFCPPTLFGPNDQTDVTRAKFFPAVMIKMLQNPEKATFIGDGSAYREIIYVKEAAKELHKCLLEAPSAGLNNVPYICKGVNKTIKQFVADIAACMDYTGEIIWGGEVSDNGQTYKSFSKPWNFQWNYDWYTQGVQATVDYYKGVIKQ